jgi:hypothetical protein
MQDQQVACSATLWQTQCHLNITFQFYLSQRICTSNIYNRTMSVIIHLFMLIQYNGVNFTNINRAVFRQNRWYSNLRRDVLWNIINKNTLERDLLALNSVSGISPLQLFFKGLSMKACIQHDLLQVFINPVRSPEMMFSGLEMIIWKCLSLLHWLL